MKRLTLALLVIIIVGIGVIGAWYLWFANDSNPSNPTPRQTQNTNSTENSRYLTIKEWSVRMQLGSEIEGANYDYKDNSIIYVSTPQTDKIAGCEDQDTMAIQRGKAENSVGATTVKELLSNNPDALTKVGEYYYAFFSSPVLCTEPNDSEGSKKLSEASQGFMESLKTLKGVN